MSRFRYFGFFKQMYIFNRLQQFIKCWHCKSFVTRFRWRKQFLIGLSAAAFTFQEFSFSENDLKVGKIDLINQEKMGWETIVQEDDLQVLRKFHTDTGLYEYRCSGSYRDVCARDFIDAQMDIEFRKLWDPNVLKLELLDIQEDSDSEVVRWVVKFPFLMYPREYVYVRRRYVDMEQKCVIIINTSFNSEGPPSSSEYVRVSTYKSTMIIHAYESFDEKGFDYALTYYENPQCNFPSYVYNWIVNNAGPYFLQRAHNAAKELETRRLKDESLNAKIQDIDKCSNNVLYSEKDENCGDELVEDPNKKDSDKKTDLINESKVEDNNRLDGIPLVTLNQRVDLANVSDVDNNSNSAKEFIENGEKNEKIVVQNDDCNEYMDENFIFLVNM